MKSNELVNTMSSMTIAIPVDSDQGLDSPASAHFGHCQAFVLSTIEDGKVVEVKTIPNLGHSSCAEPVMNLAQNGVNILIARGMGARPYMVTQQIGMSVVQGEGVTAREVIDNFLKGTIQSFRQESLCGGGLAHDN